MIDPLVPVVGIPALIAAGWTAVGLRASGSPKWVAGALVAGALAAVLVLVAAFLPLTGSLGELAVPVLCVVGGYLLMRLFSRPYAVALALSSAFALLMGLRPPLFPFLLPIVLVLPLWVVAWVEKQQGAGRFALTLLAALIAVPVAVFGAFYLVRGT